MCELSARLKSLPVIHIIGVTEVKSKNKKQKLSPSEFYLDDIDCYNLFSKNIDNDIGRGLLLYIHKSLEVKEVIMATEFQENIFVEIKSKNHEFLLVGLIYRSDSGTETNNENLLALMEEVSTRKYLHKLMMGDFNLPKIDWKLVDVKGDNLTLLDSRFLECMQNVFLFQHVQEPTRWRGDDKPRVLDLIITNEENMIEEIQYLGPLGKSDHCVLLFKLICYIKTVSNNSVRKNYDNGNYEEACKELEGFDWAQYLSSCDVENSWRVIKEKLMEIEDRYVPTRKKRSQIKKYKYPLDSITKKKIEEKNSLARKAMKRNDPKVQRAYRRVSNFVRMRTRYLRKMYEEDLVKQAKHKPKVIWNYINKRTKIKTKIGDLYSNQNDTDSLKTDDDKQKADILSDYFSSVFVTEPEGHIPELPKMNVQTKYLVIAIEDVRKLLQDIDINKSPGPDGIHPRILKELVSVIIEPLTLLFNKSLEESTLPCEWKEAQISAIFKRGDKSMAENYRPVSLTSVICKTMEKLVRNYVVDHMTTNRLFSKKQYGFISGRSTTLQLLTVLDKWTAALDKGQVVDCIYMDFQKAFDKVPHKRLLMKIRSYGLDERVIKWIQDFLYNRTQQVRVNGVMSSWKPVTSGVPQGSVLGPVLFVLYINDLPSVIQSDSDLYLFADDTKIFRIITGDTDTAQLQADLNSMSNWCDTWLLKLNPEKCKYLQLGGGHNNCVNYMVGDVLVHKVEEEKDIGVVVDGSLEFQKHICDKIKIANSRVAIIKRTFTNLSKEIVLPLYKALVRSHLEFASSVWCPYKVKYIEKIEAVQRRVTKLIPGLNVMSYEERLRHLRLPTLVYRRYRGDMIEVYKLVHKIYDSTVEPVVSFWNNKYELRGNSLKLLPKRCRCDKRKHFFALRAVKVWNELPEDVVQAPSVNSFKNRLDQCWSNKDFLYNYKARV